MPKKTAHGFTLIELLVVVAIIALLMSILLPALARAREQSKVVMCTSNAHQIAVAMLLYSEESAGILPYQFCSLSSTQSLTWDSLIHGQLGGLTPLDTLKSGITQMPPKALRCPSDVTIRPSWAGVPFKSWRSYAMPAGMGGYGATLVYTGVGISVTTVVATPSAIKLTMVANPGDTVAIAENHITAGPSGNSGIATPQQNIAGNYWGAGVARPADQGPAEASGTVAAKPMVHFGKFTYGFLDGHSESLRPQEVSRTPAKCASWGSITPGQGIGGKWVWNLDWK